MTLEDKIRANLPTVKRKIREKGFKGDVELSTTKSKKYMYIPTPEERKRGYKKVHFGFRKMEDFLVHGDLVRRRAYKKRTQGQLTKEGKPAYKVKGSAAYFSYYILW